MGEGKKWSNGSPGKGPGLGVGVGVGVGGKGRKLLTREDFLVSKSGVIGRRAGGNGKEDSPRVSLQRDTSEEGVRSTPVVSPVP